MRMSTCYTVSGTVEGSLQEPERGKEKESQGGQARAKAADMAHGSCEHLTQLSIRRDSVQKLQRRLKRTWKNMTAMKKQMDEKQLMNGMPKYGSHFANEKTWD